MVSGVAPQVHVPDHVPVPSYQCALTTHTVSFFSTILLVLDVVHMLPALGAAVAHLVLGRAACDPRCTCWGVRLLRTLFYAPRSCVQRPRVRTVSPALYHPALLVFMLCHWDFTSVIGLVGTQRYVTSVHFCVILIDEPVFLSSGLALL